MLSRLIPKGSHYRFLSRISLNSPSFPHSHFESSPQSPLTSLLRHFSSNQNNNGNGPPLFDTWNISQEGDAKFDRVFSEESGDLSGIGGTENEVGKNPVDAVDDWPTTEGYSLWSLGEEEKPETEVFDLAVDTQAAGDALSGGVEIEPADAQAAGDALSGEPAESVRSAKEEMMLQMEEEKLTEVLKGPNRAFGDLIAVSGITDDMLDSLIALKDFDGIEGLPPLREIEDERYEKSLRKNTRAEIERQKQEEIAKARVRKVDEQGRAYGTGRRKCSIARVWIQPGEGKFVINEKAFDVYFPVLDHRATLLRPFSETNTLGLWDVDCTVKGGGMSGQVGAIRLGISRALQNWEPELRPPLRSAGFLTRDSRVVERKKPGKAKARKSFQWVKR